MIRDEVLKQLKFHLQRTQDQMSKFANRHKSSAKIMVGNEIYSKIRHHKQQSMPTRINSKLAARYYDLFRVIAQMDRWLIGYNYLKMFRYI